MAVGSALAAFVDLGGLVRGGRPRLLRRDPGQAGKRRHDDRFATAPPQHNGAAYPTDGIALDAGKTWTVQVDIDEHEGRTRAIARLGTGGPESLAGTGLARLNPADRDVPEIGEELAVARALSELSHLLLEAAARDFEETSGVRAHPVL
jgi:hypothetical protein